MSTLCTRCTRFRRVVISPRMLHTSGQNDESRKIRDLLAKFQDPTSPYYIPPGATGPAHENDHTSSRPPPHPPHCFQSSGADAFTPKIQWRDPTPDRTELKSNQFRPSSERLEAGREGAESYFRENGFDHQGVLQWDVAWGDCDMFEHANNVNYVRWLESARLRWAETLVNELPTETVMNMLHGRGMGFILKDISVRYRHPLTYPDTILIAVRPHSINPSRASFGMAHALWSLKDNKLAATADSTIVMYDYDDKKRGVLSEEFMQVLEARSGVKRMEG